MKDKQINVSLWKIRQTWLKIFSIDVKLRNKSTLPISDPLIPLFAVDFSKILYKSCLNHMSRCQVIKLYDQLQFFQQEDCALAASPSDRESVEVLKLYSKLGIGSFNSSPKSSSKQRTKELIFLVEKRQQPDEQFSFLYIFLTIHW